MLNKPFTQMQFMDEVTARLNEGLDLDENGNEQWSRQDVKTVLEVIREVVGDELAAGNQVLIPGLVRLRLRYRKPLPRRKGRAFGSTEDKWFPARAARIAVKAMPAAKVRQLAPTPTSVTGKRIAAEVAKREKARAAAAKKRTAAASTNGRRKATTRRKAA